MFAPAATRTACWQRYECAAVGRWTTLQPRGRPRLTTMMAVGLSGAAVSPAMGRFTARPDQHAAGVRQRPARGVDPEPALRGDPGHAGEAAAAARAGLPAQGVRRVPRPQRPLPLRHRRRALGEHRAGRAAAHQPPPEIVCVDADAGPGNLAESISKAIDLAQLECAANIAINLDVLRADRDPSPGPRLLASGRSTSGWSAVATRRRSGSASSGTPSRRSPRTCPRSCWPTARSTRRSRG